jgi:murein DD-endopeptidase MepM/ murein hydrolase activator NlpD
MAAVPDSVLQVVVTPEALAPGEPVRITVTGPEPPSEISGSFLGRDLGFLPAPGGGSWIAFAGIDLDTKPGDYVLSIEARSEPGDDWAHAVDLQVADKAFPTERLTVESKYVEPPPEVTARIAREAATLKVLWETATPDLLYTGEVVRPLAGVKGRNFGRRRIFNDQPRSPHSGTDLSAPEGTPVEAAAAGRVALAEELYFSGNLVVLDHGGGVYTLYAHLSRIDVQVGQPVKAGAIVGLVGATGRVTGAHLHWGARIGEARVDPASLLELLTD